MERTVYEGHLHRVYGVTCQRTVRHCRLETFLNRRDELLGNVTALDGVFEYETCLFGIVVRTDLEDDIGELTATTGLFLEHLTVLELLGERLFVVDLRSALADFDTELATQTVYDHFEVKLTHTTDDGLSRIFVGLDGECRVLFGQLTERDT